jgi:hypothetical protein
VSKDYKLQHIWSQLKSTNSIELKQALDKDPNWDLTKVDGARHFYHHKSRGTDVEIHVHPSNTGGYGEKLLKGVLDDIAWTEGDMIELKLIKLKGKKKDKPDTNNLI